jgi:hypothetical protein
MNTERGAFRIRFGMPRFKSSASVYPPHDLVELSLLHVVCGSLRQQQQSCPFAPSSLCPLPSVLRISTDHVCPRIPPPAPTSSRARLFSSVAYRLTHGSTLPSAPCASSICARDSRCHHVLISPSSSASDISTTARLSFVEKKMCE